MLLVGMVLGCVATLAVLVALERKGIDAVADVASKDVTPPAPPAA